jgi:hypothetical protein
MSTRQPVSPRLRPSLPLARHTVVSDYERGGWSVHCKQKERQDRGGRTRFSAKTVGRMSTRQPVSPRLRPSLPPFLPLAGPVSSLSVSSTFARHTVVSDYERGGWSVHCKQKERQDRGLQYVERTYLKRKEVDDVLGGEDSWKNVDSTAGKGRATCAREGSAFHPVVPFRNSWKLVQQEEGMEVDDVLGGEDSWKNVDSTAGKPPSAS